MKLRLGRLGSAILFLAPSLAFTQQNPAGLALPNTAKIADVVTLSLPAQSELAGLLGTRYRANAAGRLPAVDEAELLDGFQHRPGKQAWVGEHVGKWLHAASLTYMARHDPQLKSKMDRVVSALLATQEPDGYLGTYPVGKRFSTEPGYDWDVWVHKYCLLGLLTYYQATSEPKALACARRVGDLLCSTFGPGGRQFSQAGTYQGLAATSVLEPIVLLYRATDDPRYLDFARQIVEDYDEPGGCRLVSDLLSKHRVDRSATGKAYEMLSNLVGLAELYRATGEDKYIKPVQIAWEDIVRHRLYITGTGSSREHWTADGQMPNGEEDAVGETCVTVTWIQLNTELLRLTGESRYADQIERSLYNDLLGAQRQDGLAWCYYKPLNGKRHPSSDTTCCLSSGPRGIALLTSLAYAAREGGIDVNLYGPSTYRGVLDLRQSGGYPFQETVRIQITRGARTPFTMRLRIPSWADGARAWVNGLAIPNVQPGSYLSARRRWKAGDVLRLRFPMPIRTVDGTGSNQGLRAFTCGPLVYAADVASNLGVKDTNRVSVPGIPRKVGEGQIDVEGMLADQGPVFRPRKIRMVPFFMAGENGSLYAVWLHRDPVAPKAHSVLIYGATSQNRNGVQTGSISDDEAATNSDTYTGKPSVEDWFAVEVDHPVTIDTIVFRHGHSYHDGGWFDTSNGKPRIQVRLKKGAEWVTIGTLESYPPTTPDKNPGIGDGAPFSWHGLPRRVVGIRVLGVPAHGDQPSQAFSSCAELQGWLGHPILNR